MKVQLTFDTELEKIDDLIKLRDWVQDLISKKDRNVNGATQEIKPIQTGTPLQTSQPTNKARTTGGSSVVPYEDMSGILSRIASGERIR